MNISGTCEFDIEGAFREGISEFPWPEAKQKLKQLNRSDSFHTIKINGQTPLSISNIDRIDFVIYERVFASIFPNQFYQLKSKIGGQLTEKAGGGYKYKVKWFKLTVVLKEENNFIHRGETVVEIKGINCRKPNVSNNHSLKATLNNVDQIFLRQASCYLLSADSSDVDNIIRLTTAINLEFHRLKAEIARTEPRIDHPIAAPLLQKANKPSDTYSASVNKTTITDHSKVTVASIKTVNVNLEKPIKSTKPRVILPYTPLRKFSGPQLRNLTSKVLTLVRSFEGKLSLLRQHYHLYGPPGIGKTELVIKFATEQANMFSFIVLARDILYTSRIAEGIKEAGAFQALDKRMKEQLAFKFAKEYLRNSSVIEFARDSLDSLENKEETPPLNLKKPGLIIFDDLTEEIDFSHFPAGIIILTVSENKHLFEQSRHLLTELFSLSPFTFQNTQELFQDIPPDRLIGLSNLHDQLGGHPFSLSLAYAYVQMRNRTGYTILDYLNERNQIPCSLDQDGLSNSQNKVLQLTFRYLLETFPLAAEVFGLCAFLNPNEIQQEFLTTAYENRDRAWQSQALQPLVDLRLLNFDEKKQSYRLHPLWQNFLKVQVKESGKEQEYFEKVIFILEKFSREFNAKVLESWNNGKICFLHLTNVRKDALWTSVENERKNLLLKCTGEWLLEVKNWPDASLSFFEESLALNLEKDKIEEIAINYTNLGRAHLAMDLEEDKAEEYSSLGARFIPKRLVKRGYKYHKKSLQYHQQALALLQEDPQNFFLLQAINHNCIGKIHTRNFDYEEANFHLTEALKLLQEHDKEIYYLGICCADYAFFLLKKYNPSDLPEALSNFRRALEIFFATVRNKHRYTILCLNEVSKIFAKLHDFPSQRENLLRTLDYVQNFSESSPTPKLWGKRYSTIAKIYEDLGVVSENLNSPADALHYNLEGLKIIMRSPDISFNDSRYLNCRSRIFDNIIDLCKNNGSQVDIEAYLQIVQQVCGEDVEFMNLCFSHVHKIDYERRRQYEEEQKKLENLSKILLG